MMPATLAVTPKNQRGFCPGRQFGINIVVLDTFLRVFNQCSDFVRSPSEFTPGECPALALYDICNAFPTIAHFWLFAVLQCISLNNRVYNLISNLYTNSAAYSCGIGTGNLLFLVLSGVRTGCPLSATLFLLAFNPFLTLINIVSDGPKAAVSCMCADDVGSALRALKSLLPQYSVFKLASQVSGMHLKPSKCFIVVSCVELSEHVSACIKAWLEDNIPEWSEFNIVSAGKYLGAFLGKNSCALTYQAPCSKYFDRVKELSLAKAPALASILRYNERCATVFSYVSQFMQPDDPMSFAAMEQKCVHSMLKLPPQCMSRELMHTFGDFCPVTPTAISSMCKATFVRFARSEAQEFINLKTLALQTLDEEQSLRNRGYSTIPFGGISDEPILNNIISAIHNKEIFHISNDFLAASPSHSWIQDPFGNPRISVSPQSELYKIYSISEKCPDFHTAIINKLLITVGDSRAQEIVLPVNWLECLLPILRSVRTHTSMCIFKTYIGGWTTSIRMHEPVKRSCIFGCRGQWDDLYHYIECAPLWSIASKQLDIEVPFSFASRLCLVNPSKQGVRALALTFAIYHYVKNEVELIDSPISCQQAAVEAAKSLCLHL